MAKQKKTGFGTYITTLVVDSDLTTTEARLFAFMQLHVDYRTGVFDLKRKTTCAKLDINLTTYTRALRTLIEKELVSSTVLAAGSRLPLIFSRAWRDSSCASRVI